VLHNNLALVRSVMRFTATNWCRAACIDAKFEMKNWFPHTFGVKTIPVSVNDLNDGCSNSWGRLGADFEIFHKFDGIPVQVPKVDVGAWVRVRDRGLANALSIFFEQKDGVIQIVAIV
jgi:hypothetical protein